MSAGITIVKVIMALVALAMLGMTIYFLVTQVWIGVASCASLTAILGYMTVQDIRKFVAQRK